MVISNCQIVILSGRETNRYLRYICDQLTDYEFVILSSIVDYIESFEKIRNLCRDYLKCRITDVELGHVKKQSDGATIPTIKCKIFKTSDTNFKKEFKFGPSKPRK